MSATAFQRRRRELEAQKAREEQEQVEIEAVETPEQKTVNVDDMTKNEIMVKLDDLGIEYNTQDKKEVLKGLLLNAIN